MNVSPRILLLAGSAEARRIAERLTQRGQKVTALVSEPPRGPDPMPVPYDIVAFDEPASLIPRMQDFDAVVDASHGFDGQMTHAGWAAARDTGLPFVSLARDKWSLEESPAWQSASDVRAAMSLIRPGTRVFSAAGWASLNDCAGFVGARLLLRQTSQHDRPVPYPFVELVFGTAPFSKADEMALFQDRNIDLLLCRNLGGLPSRPKLDAALALDLPVILIDPPTAPKGAKTVHEVAEAMTWIDQL